MLSGRKEKPQLADGRVRTNSCRSFCTRSVASLGVRMCCHGLVYERFSQQPSNVVPDSCPAPLVSEVVVLAHHLFASSRRRRMDSQGVPGVPHRQLGKELVVVPASKVWRGVGLVRHGKWFRQHMAAHVGRDTNIGCVSGHSGARRRKRNADLPCIIHTTTSPRTPAADHSFLPTYLSI